ncbi:MAG: hypothetical protein ABUK13_00235 [Gammaproteobacteria bacterium]
MPHLITLNRAVWSLLFLVGSALLAFWEYENSSNVGIGWFLITSIWSAVCAIAYSIIEWIIHQKS